MKKKNKIKLCNIRQFQWTHKVVPLNKNNDFNEIVKEAYEKLKVSKIFYNENYINGNIETIGQVQVT